MLGMNNNLLKIELSKNKIKEIELEEEILEDYLGGRGLGVKLLTRSIKKGIDPLSPSNPLIFSVGPLTGSTVPTSGRFSLVTKSPLTNTIFHSNTGGYFGPFFKRCGYDVLFLTGRLNTNEKGYIVIDGHDKVEIKEADSLWGLTITETVEKIKGLEGRNSQILCIGPAGENLVKISSIMNQAHRAFGRGGVGAVMGAKNIKAIVVKNGKKKFPVKDKERLKKLNTLALDKIRVVPITSQGLALFGTAALVKVINHFGMFPVRNFQEAYTPPQLIDQVSGEELRERFLEKEEGCYNCVIRCGRLTNTGELKGKGPEFESLWSLGPLTGTFDLKEITHANYACNEQGLDTISTGSTIACAMELHDMGLLNEPLLKFGNGKELVNLIEMISGRNGIGNELAEGSLRLASKYGSPESAIQVKGLELPAYDPRGAFGHALNYAVSNRGACHLTGYMIALEILGVPKKIERFTVKGKGDLLALKQNQSAVEDSLITCKFVGYALGFEFQVRFLNTILDKNLSITDLIIIGERIFNLERLFNIREGFSRKDDKLPDRFLKIPLKEGPSKNKVVPLEELLEEYYKVRGWDDNGIPTNETLTRLKLERLMESD